MTGRLIGIGGHCAPALFRISLAVACAPAVAGCVVGGDDTVPPLVSGDAGDAGDARSNEGGGGADAADARASDAKSADASTGDAPANGKTPDGAAIDAVGAEAAMGGSETGDADASTSFKDATVQDAVAASDSSPAVVEAGGIGSLNIGTLNAIDLGPVGCGSPAVTKAVTLSNGGSAPLTIQAASAGAEFSVSPASLTIPVGGLGVLGVSASASASDTVGVAIHGALNLFTTDPKNVSPVIPLSATPTGATIVVTDPTGQQLSSIGFASSPVNMQAKPVPFEVTNRGNATAVVTVGAPSAPQFSINGSTSAWSISLGAGSSWVGTAEFTPSAAGTATATALISVSGTTCGAAPSQISFSGTGAIGQISGWPGPIDFGPVNCGFAPAPRPFPQPLKNMGAVPVTVTDVSFVPAGGNGFSADLQKGTIIPPGGTLPVTVTAPQVPVTLTATALRIPISATLVVHTDADPPSGAGQSVTLSEEPTGAILSFDPNTFGNFGSVPLLGIPPTQTFGVKNSGNAPATVMFGATANDGGTSDAQADGVSLAETPPSPFNVQVASLNVTPAQSPEATDTVTFSPIAAGGATGALSMSIASLPLDGGTNAGSFTYLCQPLPPPISLAGIGIGGGLSLSPTSISFAPSCGGGAPAAQTITVSNQGTRDLSWWISANVAGPQYSVATMNSAGMTVPNPALMTPMLLRPNDFATLSISAKVLPANTTSASALDDSFTLSTDVPFDPPHVVPLHEVPIGDQLTISPATLGFGHVAVTMPATTTQPQSVIVTNNSNPGPNSAPASFSLTLEGAGASAYSLGSSSGLSLAPGASLAVPVAFAPTSMGLALANIALSTTDSLCAPLPQAVQLVATGTAGQVAVSAASTLNFGTDLNNGVPTTGLVNCGATGTSQTFTVANTGNQAFNITAQTIFGSTGKSNGTYFQLGLTSSSGATLALPASVPSNDQVTVTVTPLAIPQSVANPFDPGPFSDTLTLTTDAAGDSAHTINLVMQARGAIIAGTPPSGFFFKSEIYGSKVFDIGGAIANAGNAPAWVTLTGAGDGGLALANVFGLQSNPTIVAPGSPGTPVSTSINGQFTPPSADGTWTDQGFLTVTADAWCQAPHPPAAWQSAPVVFSGSSTSSPAVTLSGTLAFPATDCGKAPPGGLPLTLTNLTNQTFPITLTFDSGKYYTAADGPGVLPANGSLNIIVTPNGVNPGPGVLAGAAPYADNLTITVGSPPVISFSQPVSWALDGAVLSLPSGAGPYKADSNSTHTLPVTNSGNTTVTVDFAVQPAGAFTFLPTPPISVGPASTVSPVLTSATAPACPAVSNRTLSFVVSGPVCQPLPTSVTVASCVGTQ